jgi:hypothetical protein
LSQAAAPLIQGRFVPVSREYAAACLQRAPPERSLVGDGDELVERHGELRERVVEGLQGPLRRDGEDECLVGRGVPDLDRRAVVEWAPEPLARKVRRRADVSLV